MTRSVFSSAKLLPFAILAFMLLVLYLFTKSKIFLETPGIMSTAVTADMVFTVPVVYFLLIRKKSIPNITVVPVFLACLLLASIVVPKQEQHFLDWVIYYVLPVVELTVISLVIYKVRQAVKLFKDKAQMDFYDTLKNVTADVLPARVSAAAATEIAAFYYAFFNWKKINLEANQFTYHKESGTRQLLGVFVFLILIETVVVHLLLQQWSVTAAWILSIITVYTAIQLFAIMKSLSKRPIVIDSEYLTLRYGLFGDAQIPLIDIEKVELAKTSIDNSEQPKYLSPFYQNEGHNLVIHLRKPQFLYGLYGFKKQFQTIAFHADDPKALHGALNKSI